MARGEQQQHGVHARPILARPLQSTEGMRLTFDRGTILIDSPPAGLPLADLPGVRWDPRVRHWRAPAHLLAPLRGALVALGVELSNHADCVGARPSSWRAVRLGPYQEAALAAWELQGRRGVVVLPTGSGKTRVALAAMARSRLRTLCLVPTRVLLDQWCGALRAVCRGPVGRFGDGDRQIAPVTVATMESAWRHMDRLGRRFELLVADEAHHFGGGLRDEALEMSTAPFRLGLTATPRRDEAARRVTSLLGPVVYELAIRDLEGEFLAPFDLVRLTLDLSPAERREYDEDDMLFRTAFDAFRRASWGASWRGFVRWAAPTPEGRAALAAWRRSRSRLAFTEGKAAALAMLLARHRGARLLVFTADNATAYHVARHHLIMPITCHVRRAERDEALARFRRGELRALVSSRVLNEGLDVPSADVGILVGAAQGEREYVQRVGRLLRPAPGKRALVYELVTRDTVEVRRADRRRRALASRAAG